MYQYPNKYQGHDVQNQSNFENNQQSYPFATYGVQTPCYKYKPVDVWEPYGGSVCSTQPNSTTYDVNYLWTDEFLLKRMILSELKDTVDYYQELEKEHIKMMHNELDELKAEVRLYQEEEAKWAVELAKELRDLKEEILRNEENEAKETTTEVAWRVEKIVEPQPVPPPYILQLPFPQRAMLNDTAVDRGNGADGVDAKEVKESFIDIPECQ